MKRSAHGFSLIELLVVMAITATTGVFVLANYRTFGEDQHLKNAVLEIQSMLRQAQTNATSNVKCNDLYGATWQVYFFNRTTIRLNCRGSLAEPFVTQKELSLRSFSNNITIQSVSAANCVIWDSAPPFPIDFEVLKGTVSRLGTENRCSAYTITLTNTKTTKSITIERGGRIYEP